MAQQFPPPNAHGGVYENREHSLYTSSCAGDTAYEPGEQRSPTFTNSSDCSGCSGTDYGNDDIGDLRRNPEKPLHGWPALAKAMEKYSDFEAFPTFRDLNIKSLLYYQAELDDLRYQLQECEWEDHRFKPFSGAEKLSSNVIALMDCKAGDERKRIQVDLIKEIRRVLKEYNTALLEYSQINALPEAEDLNVKSLRTWLTNEKMGNLQISGRGANTWGDLAQKEIPNTLGQQFLKLVKSVFWTAKEKQNRHKLVVPRKPMEVDGLTKWIAQEWVPFWQKLREAETEFRKNPPWKRPPRDNREKQEESELPIGRPHKAKSAVSISSTVKRWKLNVQRIISHEDPQEHASQPSKEKEKTKTLNQYAMSRMLKFTSLVATLIACLLPIIAITVLAKVHTQAKILGYMALFTALFALGLMWLTNPGTARTEIFTATAAFSAVLVVFVQNQNGNSNGP